MNFVLYGRDYFKIIGLALWAISTLVFWAKGLGRKCHHDCAALEEAVSTTSDHLYPKLTFLSLIGSLQSSSNLVDGPSQYHHARPPNVLQSSHSWTTHDYFIGFISRRLMDVVTRYRSSVDDGASFRSLA